MTDQPQPKRRRVAPPVADPMAPTGAQPAPTSRAEAPTTAPSVTTTQPEPATEPVASRTRTSGRPSASQATVSVFLRTDPEVKEQFEALGAAAGLTQRGMFDHLVAEAWTRYQRTGNV